MAGHELTQRLDIPATPPACFVGECGRSSEKLEKKSIEFLHRIPGRELMVQIVTML
jgi:hypothetical protein